MSEDAAKLDFTGLGGYDASMPQITSIRSAAERLAQNADVDALWVGGSFARGEADAGSDIDLRIAVKDSAWESWSQDPGRAAEHAGMRPVASQTISFGASVLLHALLDNAVIADVLMQSATTSIYDEATVVLFCRDDALASRLANTKTTEETPPPTADPETVRRIVSDFWINTSKHAKVLDRKLEMLAVIGLGHERNTLLRLWYIDVTGNDTDPGRAAIFPLTRMLRPIREIKGRRALELMGQPMRSRAEIEEAIENNRAEVARVGRVLAERFGFKYPTDAEAVATRAWKTRKDAAAASASRSPV